MTILEESRIIENNINFMEGVEELGANEEEPDELDDDAEGEESEEENQDAEDEVSEEEIHEDKDDHEEEDLETEDEDSNEDIVMMNNDRDAEF
ncbi:hypothetical protein TELCIR_24712 [Teladorsagia circumcincta]|uniref:Uncharacterized protein n=1 Tax=Teladorsagia circumcincta TaxID=45464 RepID=A0A2G9T7J2_TELCI|nr:hypothetical protein TELCIR_24712 [Teladorsagia circumcincta]